MNNPVITIREFGFLTMQDTGDLKDCKTIGKEAFENLRKYILDERNDVSSILTLSFKKGYGEIIRIKNYVGVIQTNDGTIVEILPKIYKVDSDLEARKAFLKMLKTLQNSPYKSISEASLKNIKFPILEIFISLFLSELGILIRKGLKKSYVPIEENSIFLKGKLKIKENIKINLINQEYFFIEHDQFIENNSENRLIKTTLSYLKKISKSKKNKQMIAEYMFIFHEVDESPSIANDFESIDKIGRLYSHYEKTLVWVRIFLKRESIVSFAGNTIALSLLFPMEKLFESYVAQSIRKTGFFDSVNTQDSSYSLIEQHINSQKFSLRPDIILNRNSNDVIILDTKWKEINEHDSQKNNYNISQADMYQMYAYAKKYKSKELYLIYPKTETFLGKIPDFLYHIGVEKIILRVIWFDVINDEISNFSYGKWGVLDVG